MLNFLSTESLARASARRPWLVIGAWALALLIALGLIATLLGSALTTNVDFTSNPESKRANTLLEDRLRGPQKANEIVIVQSADKTVDDPEFKARVEDIYGRIVSLGSGTIAAGRNYYLSGDESLVSKDRHTTILPFVMSGTLEQAKDHIGPAMKIAEQANGVGGFRVLISGTASINEDIQTAAERDLQTGETLGIPIALIVLLIVFGAVTAALIPLVLGIFAIVVALGLTALVGQQWHLSFFMVNVLTMMGLAVGIDYSLFVVSRFREERARGLDKHEAIAAAGATSSRAVLFSGMTVVLALLGMFIVPSTIFRSLAAGAIIVVFVSVMVSLTLLPAILGLLGDRINSLRLPLIGRRSTRPGGKSAGFWDRATRTVMRHPVVALVAVAALLIALAIPYMDIKTGDAGVSSLPDGLQTKDGFYVLERDFSFGLITPAEVAIKGDVNGPDVQAAVGRLKTLLATDHAFGPGLLQVNPDGDVGLFSVPVNGDPTGDEALSAIERLRGTYIPQAFAGVNAEALVGGASAMNLDYFNQTDRYTPIVIAFVLALSFVLLTVVFRSLVVPIKAIIMNLLSVGAAYGLLVLVFEKGVGNGIFGFRQVDIIEAWVPLFNFSILFGLSMDYHVFLLSRIREHYNQTHDNTESVAFGLSSSAGIITGAALIMVAVFAGIAAGDMVMFQQMGFGLGVAVLLDATLVRSVLVPAAMALLGDRNWYLPRILQWLPEMRTETREPVPGGAEAG